MVGHGGSSAGSYLADPTSPIPSHCASIVATSTLRVKVKPYAVYNNFLDITNYGNCYFLAHCNENLEYIFILDPHSTMYIYTQATLFLLCMGNQLNNPTRRVLNESHELFISKAY